MICIGAREKSNDIANPHSLLGESSIRGDFRHPYRGYTRGTFEYLMLSRNTSL